MPDLVQEKLHAILVDHGRRVMDDPARLEAILRDHCGERRREVSALVSALREGVPASLGAGPAGVPREALIATLARRLHENQGLTDDLARWAVETWAFGLGVGDRVGIQTAPHEPLRADKGHRAGDPVTSKLSEPEQFDYGWRKGPVLWESYLTAFGIMVGVVVVLVVLYPVTPEWLRYPLLVLPFAIAGSKLRFREQLRQSLIFDADRLTIPGRGEAVVVSYQRIQKLREYGDAKGRRSIEIQSMDLKASLEESMFANQWEFRRAVELLAERTGLEALRA